MGRVGIGYGLIAGAFVPAFLAAATPAKAVVTCDFNAIAERRERGGSPGRSRRTATGKKLKAVTKAVDAGVAGKTKK